ncbi:MAG: hypothetical protein WCA20_06565 [Candidatus Sulfotelmatobacter sp.]
MRVSFIIAFAAILCLCAPAQNSVAEEYEDQDTYAIYSRLLPGEQSYGFAKGIIVIQQETTAPVKLDDYCLTPEAAREFKDAIEDYKRHTEPMLLQRRFEIDKPYELVSTEVVGTLIKNYNWDDFYKRYPDSGGIVRMTAVGFNRQRTLAIVFTGSQCNNLCGRGSFVLLKKLDGKWKPVPGVRCSVAS